MLARAEAAELVLSELGGLKRGTLAVQASQTIVSYWLPRHLVAFRRAYPGIEIRLTIGNTAAGRHRHSRGHRRTGLRRGGGGRSRC